MIRRLSGFAFLCLVASPLLGATLHMSIRHESATLDGRKPTGQIVFVGERLIADLDGEFDGADVENRPALKGDDWWKQLTWSVRRLENGPLAPTLHVTKASDAPLRMGGILGGSPPGFSVKRPDPESVRQTTTVDLGQLSPGNYVIEAAMGSLRSDDTLFVSRGDETPEIRWLYLRTQAQAARSWEEYQKIQLVRAGVIPEHAGAFTELGHRATRDGTLAEAMDYFNRAIGVHEMNLRDLAANGKMDLRSRSRHSIAEYALGNLRAIRNLLPHFYARRGELELVEYWDEAFPNRWGLKDVRTGRIVRVGDPTAPAAKR